MIQWPDDSILSPDAKDNIARFRGTAGAKALDEDTQRWVLQSWARMPDPPYRMILMSDSNEEAVVTIEANGMWNLARRSLR